MGFGLATYSGLPARPETAKNPCMISLPDYLKPLERVSCPFPEEAFKEAVARREESLPILLQVLEWTIEHAEEVPDDYMLHECALRLLAQFRETRAFEPALRLTKHPLADELLGDTLAADMGCILASVSGGDSESICKLIEDEGVDEFARASGLQALGALCRAGQLSRKEFSRILGEFFDGKLERRENFVWTALVYLCVDFGFSEHWEAFRPIRAGAWTVLQTEDWNEMEEPMKSNRFDEAESRYYLLIDNAADTMKDWDCFKPGAVFSSEDEDEDDWEDEDLLDDAPSRSEKLEEISPLDAPVQPLRVDPKPGRNDPCACGSGKKSKKCCG